MSRTIQGPTLGGDFVVANVATGERHLHLGFELEVGSERAVFSVSVDPSRFRRLPELGDVHRLALGLTPLEHHDDYDVSREPKVGIPISFVARIIEGLEQPDEEVRDELVAELSKIQRALETYHLSEGDPA